MTQTQPGTPSQPGPAATDAEDPRVVQALHEYLAALEAAARPDRAEFLARHADIALALADYLDPLELVP